LPEECRICGASLIRLSRIPVCAECLQPPEPLSAEYFCVCCRTPFLNAAPLDEQGRCRLCRQGMRGFDAAYSWGAYEGRLRDLIHLFKYGGIRPLARCWASGWLWRCPGKSGSIGSCPFHCTGVKRWPRGFNQSELLARAIARRYGMPISPVLRRVRATAVQAGLSHSARRANVEGAFRVRRGVSLEGRRVLLVDDVMTTGATASACARALKQAGARYVAVLTLARADRRPLAATGLVQEAA
jgi:ComF family protein